MNPILISSTGSDRATGYNMSSKIIRTADALFVGWLDAPSAPGDTAKLRLGAFDPHSAKHMSTQTLGEGIDNHCGPALAMDPGGRMHTIIGTHHAVPPSMERHSRGIGQLERSRAPGPG